MPMQRGYLNSIFWVQKDDSGLEHILRGIIAEKNYFVFSNIEQHTIADRKILKFELLAPVLDSTTTYRAPPVELQTQTISFIGNDFGIGSLQVNYIKRKIEQKIDAESIKQSNSQFFQDYLVKMQQQQDRNFIIRRISDTCVYTRSRGVINFKDTQTGSTYALGVE